ncbi:hypothetical protein CFP56_018144 [Quercus suber]|uniref:Uncharacterized protein n=1 Tax=Quercus suber TaxID=58331 RepID=A0AAW0KIY1_QUESU
MGTQPTSLRVADFLSLCACSSSGVRLIRSRNVEKRLFEWSKHSFGNIRRQLEEKTKELIKAELAAANRSDCDVVRVIQVKVNELLEKESLMWQQRARNLFLKSGDRNTCYFHQKPSHKYKRNRILGLKNNNDPRSRDGAYSVKSGYKMLMELKEETKTATNVSSVDEMKSTWNAI